MVVELEIRTHGIDWPYIGPVIRESILNTLKQYNLGGYPQSDKWLCNHKAFTHNKKGRINSVIYVLKDKISPDKPFPDSKVFIDAHECLLSLAAANKI